MGQDKTHEVARHLLGRVARTQECFKSRYRETGEKFNIFEITGIKDGEIKVCRVLADLLNPRGKHYQGNRYLRLFWETIVSKLSSHLALDIEHTRVTPEYVIDENRRIDIVLEDGNVFVPIEVKIRAGDQPNQVHDYYVFSQKKQGGTRVVYLTLDGHAPTIPYSAKSEREYFTISFTKDILPWLERCLEQGVEKAVPVRETLKQLIGAVKSLCGQEENAEMDEIFWLITESEESAKAAATVGEAMNSLDSKVRELFKGPVHKLVKEKLDANYSTDYENEHWYPIYFEVKKGKYQFYINYDWNRAMLYAGNKDDISSEEGKVLRDIIVRLLYADNSGKVIPDVNDDRAGWWIREKTCYPDPAFAVACADRQVYLCHLYKLYTEKPQEAADKIVFIARALENVKI
jgi:hypothetical protein